MNKLQACHMRERKVSIGSQVPDMLMIQLRPAAHGHRVNASDKTHSPGNLYPSTA